MLRDSAFRHGPGGCARSSGGKGKNDEYSQLVAVAVDGDKNSQHALKWAADHVISRGHIFDLLHVRKPTMGVSAPAGQYLPISEHEGEAASPISEQMDIHTQELLVPFQCFCKRRELNCMEVILDDMNIPKTIVDFLMQHGVDKLVLGASSRNAFSRTLMQADVPSCVSKCAPEFCSVYVISKGKMSSSRPATRPKTCSVGKLAS